ncbi:MAG: pyridoxal phosphate-dependent aminotransferase [Polyangiaceae bacterium]
MARWLPPTAINRFRAIYRLLREREAATGEPCLDLSMGNPDRVPPEDLLSLQSRLARDPARALHTYAEDDDIGGFSARMVDLHGRIRSADHPHLAVLPIPGIKTASALLPLACGAHLRRSRLRIVIQLPAYDIVGTWGAGYLDAERIHWPLRPADGMRLHTDHLEAELSRRGLDRADLIVVIRPGNPAPVGATEAEWLPLIEHCRARGTRLVNDAAYAGLMPGSHAPLASVAARYPDLEWMELYSASKSFSDPGARLGALVGSRDFVSDFELIKGNADSGPVPYIMAAYAEYLSDEPRARSGMSDLASLYAARVESLTAHLRRAGLRQACPTEAGFFTLWQVPRRVLGVDLASHAAREALSLSDAFNRLVARETGIVGVHFDGAPPGELPQPLIRYAVCTDVLSPRAQSRLERELPRLRPEYE